MEAKMRGNRDHSGAIRAHPGSTRRRWQGSFWALSIILAFTQENCQGFPQPLPAVNSDGMGTRHMILEEPSTLLVVPPEETGVSAGENNKSEEAHPPLAFQLLPEEAAEEVLVGEKVTTEKSEIQREELVGEKGVGGDLVQDFPEAERRIGERENLAIVPAFSEESPTYFLSPPKQENPIPSSQPFTLLISSHFKGNSNQEIPFLFPGKTLMKEAGGGKGLFVIKPLSNDYDLDKLRYRTVGEEQEEGEREEESQQVSDPENTNNDMILGDIRNNPYLSSPPFAPELSRPANVGPLSLLEELGPLI